MIRTDRSTTGRCSGLHSTYLGGNVTDFGFGIAVNRAGNAYVTGVESEEVEPQPFLRPLGQTARTVFP
ncbi:MAG: SBBP repeat-containing protein [Gammaproteobacteria bacterium]